eukprot:1678809-Rhodomonas_salina.1
MAQYTQKHDKDDTQRLEATMAHIQKNIDFEGPLLLPSSLPLPFSRPRSLSRSLSLCPSFLGHLVLLPWLISQCKCGPLPHL